MRRPGRSRRAGILLPDFPEEYGVRRNLRPPSVVLEELARAESTSAPSSRVSWHYILAYAERAERRLALAHGRVELWRDRDDRAGRRLRLCGIQTTARRDGDHYVINGSKPSSQRPACQHYLPRCETNPKVAGMRGISLLVVEPQSLPATASGARSTKSACTRRTLASSFRHVRVPVATCCPAKPGIRPDDGAPAVRTSRCRRDRVATAEEAVPSQPNM